MNLAEKLASKRKTKTIDIGGESVIIHELTTSQIIEINETLSQNQKDITRREALILMAGCPDLAGAEVEQVMAIPREMLGAAAVEVMALCGLTDEKKTATE